MKLDKYIEDKTKESSNTNEDEYKTDRSDDIENDDDDDEEPPKFKVSNANYNKINLSIIISLIFLVLL